MAPWPRLRALGLARVLAVAAAVVVVTVAADAAAAAVFCQRTSASHSAGADGVDEAALAGLSSADASPSTNSCLKARSSASGAAARCSALGPLVASKGCARGCLRCCNGLWTAAAAVFVAIASGRSSRTAGRSVGLGRRSHGGTGARGGARGIAIAIGIRWAIGLPPTRTRTLPPTRHGNCWATAWQQKCVLM